MLDMINCLAIYNGDMAPKKTQKKWRYEEAMALR